jgi:hypothetical protein
MRTIIYAVNVAAFLTLFLCSSCEKDNSDKGIDGPWLKGNLGGTVRILNEFGFRDTIADLTQISITLEKTSYKTYPDTEGNFCFSDIPTGTYNILYNCENYPGTAFNSFQFIGGEDTVFADNKVLSPTTTTEISSFSINSPTLNTEFTIGISPTPSPAAHEQRNVILYFDDSEALSDINYTQFATIGFYEESTSTVTLTSNYIYESLYEYFPSGTEVYVKAYGISSSGVIWQNFYWDIHTNCIIFPTINRAGASEVLSFIMP